MNTRQVCYAQMANIVVRFGTAEGLSFAADADIFHGFEVHAPSRPADYDIEVCLASSPTDDTLGIVSHYSSMPATTDGMGHTWQLLVAADGRQCVEVSYEQHPTLRAASVTFAPDGKGTMRLCPHAPMEVIDDLFIFPLINICLSRMLLMRRGFLIHSSVVNDGGEGYLFTAISGTGKSTMARLWQECGAEIVNDDMLAIVAQSDGSFAAHNISMPYYADVHRSVPLRAALLISQSPTNYVRRIGGASSVLRLLSNTISQPVDQQSASTHLSNVAAMCNAVEVYELGFRPDTDIVYLVRQTLGR